MSSSGIDPINSGPLIIRTYLDSSENNTYVVGLYDIPVPSNRVLITSTNGLLVPSDSITISTINISTINTSTLNVSTLNVSNVADISTLIVSTLHVERVDGCLSISTILTPVSQIFNTPGSYIVPIEDETSFTFEMIGAGGFGGGLGGVGGTGGYMTGTINLPLGATQIQVVVGGVGGGAGGGPSGASYINIPGTGPLFAIAGAGGASDGLLVVSGWGGGGAAVVPNGVAPGSDAGTPGVGGGGGSVVTLTQGGLAGSECLGVFPATAGGDAGSSGLYEQALGGSFPVTSVLPGGSGYAGGGSGCGGGGGSSYADAVTTVVVTSYDGNSVPPGTLPGYGRSNQGGYVSIILSHGSCNNVSLTTNGGVIVGTTLVASTMVIGTGTSNFALEINQTGINDAIGVGFAFTNLFATGQALPYPGPGVSGPINVKTTSGIWATNFFATSDQRVKKDIQALEDAEALQLIRKLHPVSYKYIDDIHRHTQREYGFIAQDVFAILPSAVRRQTDFVPNVYDFGEISHLDGGTSMIMLRSTTVAHISANDMIKILDRKQQSHLRLVLDVNHNYVVIDGTIDDMVYEDELTEADKTNDVTKHTVFVYGTQVSDLHVLDKQSIFSVSVGAIQELDRMMLQQQLHIKELESKLELLSLPK